MLIIAANTQKVDVDNRMSLRYYYWIDDNILKVGYTLDFFQKLVSCGGYYLAKFGQELQFQSCLS